MQEMEIQNAKLRAENEPLVTKEEVIGGRLYSGPMYVKYNAVLRGIASSVDFLQKQLIELCCSYDLAVVKDYSNRKSTRLVPILVVRHERVHLRLQHILTKFEAVKPHINLYTTTLHVINSLIVKLGKLTNADKVYRGVSGMVLPNDFFKANKYGVKGGVESAFMSTTRNLHVAMDYASKKGAGFIFEIQQGMVNRGADIEWLSQYPHEKEVDLLANRTLNACNACNTVFKSTGVRVRRCCLLHWLGLRYKETVWRTLCL